MAAAISIGTGLAIAGASTVAGAVISSIGASKAAGAARDAANAANAEQRYQYDQTRTDQAPWRNTGSSALSSIAKLYGLDTTDANGNVIKGTGKANFSSFTASPDYQFNLQQGQQAIDRSAAARGGLLSGAAVREGERYASGLASQEYGGYVNRLAQVAGVGQAATNATDAFGQDKANAISNNYINAGNARASAYLDQSQSISNGINGLASNYLYASLRKPS